METTCNDGLTTSERAEAREDDHLEGLHSAPTTGCPMCADEQGAILDAMNDRYSTRPDDEPAAHYNLRMKVQDAWYLCSKRV